MASTSSAARILLSYTGTGKIDALLTATSLLKRRINSIREAKVQNGFQNPNPTPAELAKTHFLPVVDSFKPHVIAAIEYHRQSPTTGGGSFGRESTYEIPLVGDLFSDCVVEVNLPVATCGPVTFGGPSGTPVGLLVMPRGQGSSPQFTQATLSGAGLNSVFTVPVGSPLNIPYNTTGPAFKIIGTTADSGTLPSGLPYSPANYFISRNYRFVNKAGAIVMGADGTSSDGVSPSTTIANWIKMVDWPGLRLFDKVSFDINNNLVDDYDYLSAVRFMRHNVPADKMAAYRSLLGHESSPQVSNSKMQIAGDQSQITTTGRVAAQYASCQQTVTHSYQTGQPQIQAHIFHPLLFWFCLSKRSAIPGVCMPDGQKHIKLQFTDQRNVFVPSSPDLFVEETAYFSPNGGAATLPCYKIVRKFPVLVPGSEIQVAAENDTYLHICNIFMDQDIHDIFISRVSFMLVRLHRYITHNIMAPIGNNRISNNIKYPVEYIHIGFTESVLLKNNVASTSSAQNDGSAVVNHYRNDSDNKFEDYARLWWRTGLNRLEQQDRLSSSRYTFVDAAGDPLAAPGAAVGTDSIYVGMFGASDLVEPANGGPLAAGTYVHQISQIDCLEHVSNRPLIAHIDIQAQGATIWSNYNPILYNFYLSFQYGADAIRGTEDESEFFFTWAIYPGMFQPSGFLNFSRLREIDVHFATKDNRHIGPAADETLNNVTMHTLGSSLNFFLIADGTALIRYI